MRAFDGVAIAAFGALLIAIGTAPGGGGAGPGMVNGVLGDASFIQAFGRRPGPGDSDAIRIRTHLAYVERLLRAVDVSGWSEAARERRRENLDRLHAYAAAGRFPTGDSPERRLPTFIDDAGRRCAVAALVEASAGPELAFAIGRRFRNAYISAIDDPAFDAWVSTSGLTRDELAMIQPAYGFLSDEPSWQIDWRLGAETLLPLNATDANPARGIEAAEGGVRYVTFPNRFLTGKWTLGADGAAGATFAGDLYYRFVLRGGMVFSPIFFGNALGIDAGVGGEHMGAALSHATILPFEVYWNVDSPTLDGAGKAARVQLRGEGQVIFVGGREREVAWAADVDLFWFFERRLTALHLPALILTAGMRELGGVRYAVLSVGVGARELETEHVHMNEIWRRRWGWGTPP